MVEPEQPRQPRCQPVFVARWNQHIKIKHTTEIPITPTPRKKLTKKFYMAAETVSKLSFLFKMFIPAEIKAQNHNKRIL